MCLFKEMLKSKSEPSPLVGVLGLEYERGNPHLLTAPGSWDYPGMLQDWESHRLLSQLQKC